MLTEFYSFYLWDRPVFALYVVQRVVHQPHVFLVAVLQKGALHAGEGLLDLLGLKALDFFVFSQGVAEDSEGPFIATSLQINLLLTDVQQELAQNFLQHFSMDLFLDFVLPKQTQILLQNLVVFHEFLNLLLIFDFLLFELYSDVGRQILISIFLDLSILLECLVLFFAFDKGLFGFVMLGHELLQPLLVLLKKICLFEFLRGHVFHLIYKLLILSALHVDLLHKFLKFALCGILLLFENYLHL